MHTLKCSSLENVIENPHTDSYKVSHFSKSIVTADSVLLGVDLLTYIFYRLPKDVMVNEDTKLARWDQSARIWRIGGLDDVKIDTGMVTLEPVN